MVCGKVKQDEDNGNYYTIQIGRVKYKPNTDNDANNVVTRFCNFDYANAANTDAGTLKEVVSNLSTNKNEIYFRIRLKDESVVHVGYDFETFKSKCQELSEPLGS